MSPLFSAFAKYAPFCWVAALSAAPAPEVPRPNILIINIDDMAYADMGCFGSSINATPHMDALAARGLSFTSFCAAPTCTPSRAALLTGCYAHRIGINSAAIHPDSPEGISAEEYTLAEMLRDSGYMTVCIGKWGLGDQPPFFPTRHGFDRYFGILHSNDMGPLADGAFTSVGGLEKGLKTPALIKKDKERSYPPLVLMRQETSIARVGPAEQEALMTLYTDEAIKTLEEFAGMKDAQKDKRLFLYLAYNAVHGPHYPNAQYRGSSKAGALYNDLVQQLDGDIGRLMDTLRRLNLEKDTLVMLTSDNGGTKNGVNAPLRGFKGEVWEGGFRVPTIFAWPDRVPVGKKTDQLTAAMDILPTFAGLAGNNLAKAKPIDGLDFSNLLLGKAEKGPRNSFLYFAPSGRLLAVRQGDWKLVLQPSVQLYNLKDDIGESRDLASSNPTMTAALKAFAAEAESRFGKGRQPGPDCRPCGVSRPPHPVPLPAP